MKSVKRAARDGPATTGAMSEALNRRDFLKTAAGATLVGLLGRSARAADAAKKPNILLIMADDLGYEVIGANGGTSYATPNLDRLAAEGTRFTHAYCTPRCSPTRILLMTGRYGFRNYKGWGILDPAEKTFGHVLRDAGYATCVSGKWQLCEFDKPENADHPRRAGFQEHCVWTWHYKKGSPSRYWDPLIWQNGKLLEGTEGKYGPDIHCDYVCDFIERNKSRPFFAYYSTNLVHAPFVPTPDSWRESGPKSQGKKDKGGGQANYTAMVAYLDKCVGRVVTTLDRLGLRENTLILFTADNGTPRGIQSKMGEMTIPGGKGQMTDLGTHVPLIANWDGTTPAGRVLDDLIDFSDVLPTLGEMAGAALPQDRTIDGRSFLPQLRGEKGNPREWAYIHHGTATAGGNMRALRTQRWKLYGDGRLFDMNADLFEKTPVAEGAGGEEAAQARKRLAAVLASLT